MEIATGAAQPIVGRDRESVVIYQVGYNLNLCSCDHTFPTRWQRKKISSQMHKTSLSLLAPGMSTDRALMVTINLNHSSLTPL